LAPPQNGTLASAAQLVTMLNDADLPDAAVVGARSAARQGLGRGRIRALTHLRRGCGRAVDAARG
jgi:hypothetical protein